MTLDPTLKDLRAEIDYEIKLFDKNGREKITRNRKSIDSVSFALEQSIEGASLNGEGEWCECCPCDFKQPLFEFYPRICNGDNFVNTLSFDILEAGGLVSQPMEESADNFKKRSLMTPSKQQQQQESERERASSTNPSLTGNNTPFKNIKGMAFPSPLKSSRSINTSSNERQLERSILTDAINEDCEDDKKKEEEDEEQASQTRLSRRRRYRSICHITSLHVGCVYMCVCAILSQSTALVQSNHCISSSVLSTQLFYAIDFFALQLGRCGIQSV